MTDRLALSALNFGKTDAKSDILSRNQKDVDFFYSSFTIPNEEEINEIILGNRFIVHGSKGTGKTALLRYLHSLSKKENSPSKFIIFSEDVSEGEKKHMLKMAGVDIEETPVIGEDQEVATVWQLFIFRQLAYIFEENLDFLDNRDGLAAFINITKVIYDQDDGPLWKRLLRLVRKGTVTIKAGNKNTAEAGVSVEIEKPKHKEERPLHVVINNLESALRIVEFPKDISINLFIDELNLSLVSLKQHRRDTILIRDLIIAGGRLNRLFAEHGLPIYIYMAVRSEVVSSRNMPKNEVQKYFQNHGHCLSWYKRGDVDRYPIFNLITKKIQTSEDLALKKHNNDSSIWNTYFAKDIYGIDAKTFLSEITWCNPRDMVLILTEAKKGQFGTSKFDTALFDRALDAYSKEMWKERSEELSTQYSQPEINAIKRVITGLGAVFKVDWFTSRAENLAEKDQKIMQLIKTKTPLRILEDLYYIGVIGQSYARSTSEKGVEKQRSISEKWFYRVQDEFDQTAWCVLHRGLRPEFQVEKFSAKDFKMFA